MRRGEHGAIEDPAWRGKRPGSGGWRRRAALVVGLAVLSHGASPASRGARATGYLDEAWVAALRPSVAGRPMSREGSPGSGLRVSGGGGTVFGGAAVAAAPRRPGDVFRDCPECPEMVVLAGGGLAMGRYEVTVGEYRVVRVGDGGRRGRRVFHAR